MYRTPEQVAALATLGVTFGEMTSPGLAMGGDPVPPPPPPPPPPPTPRDPDGRHR